ncbi:hypothetical protein AAG570_005541 [Ranatra chinensis]|uniref:Uncharacterized protein n=1 Tax=Ranatra chinensis TaxID=642074 RepID=A0ABD0XXQ7_9HEMI
MASKRRNVLREQEAGDNGNRYVQFAIFFLLGLDNKNMVCYVEADEWFKDWVASQGGETEIVNPGDDPEGQIMRVTLGRGVRAKRGGPRSGSSWSSNTKSEFSTHSIHAILIGGTHRDIELYLKGEGSLGPGSEYYAEVRRFFGAQTSKDTWRRRVKPAEESSGRLMDTAEVGQDSAQSSEPHSRPTEIDSGDIGDQEEGEDLGPVLGKLQLYNIHGKANYSTFVFNDAKNNPCVSEEGSGPKGKTSEGSSSQDKDNLQRDSDAEESDGHIFSHGQKSREDFGGARESQGEERRCWESILPMPFSGIPRRKRAEDNDSGEGEVAGRNRLRYSSPDQFCRMSVHGGLPKWQDIRSYSAASGAVVSVGERKRLLRVLESAAGGGVAADLPDSFGLVSDTVGKKVVPRVAKKSWPPDQPPGDQSNK